MFYISKNEENVCYFLLVYLHILDFLWSKTSEKAQGKIAVL